MTFDQLDPFTLNYLAAGCQLREDYVRGTGNEPDADYYVHDFAPAELARAAADCAAFQAANAADLADADPEQAGTDYWLNRNHHGSGYWSREEVYGEGPANRLDIAAQAAGETDVYRGDDGRLYLYPPAL